MSSSDLDFLTIAELGERIRKGAVSSLEVTKAQLARIERLDPFLRSYASVFADAALEEAKLADQELRRGIDRGPLHGIPVGIKDLCWVRGHPTSAGTAVFKDFVPVEDATVVRRLRNDGAIILGKLQLTEAAYSDHHPDIEPPRNPWDPDFWPGISSSGSGVALAAGLCFGAIGTDTGGSIRWPSAANGVTGLKPTWGRVSRYGVFELAASLDHVGSMARNAADAGIIFSAMAGGDPLDPTALDAPMPRWSAAGHNDVAGLRIGIEPNIRADRIDSGTRAMLGLVSEVMTSLGAGVVDVELPDPSPVIHDWAQNCAIEAAVAHEATYPARKAQYGPVLAGVLDRGRMLSGMDYQKILIRRTEFAGRLKRAMRDVDLLLLPVQPIPPLTLEAARTLGSQPELIAALQRYTCPFNMTGNPTITLPGGFSDTGMPIGFQLVGHHLREDMLIRAGIAFQNQTSWHRRHPIVS